MVAFPKYESYENSGIEWFGDIPKHWTVKRAKHVSSIFVPQRNKPELNSSEGIPWITTEDLSASSISESSFGYFVSLDQAKKAGSRVLPENSVIASCVGNFGVSSVNTNPVIINQQLQAFIPKTINSWYLRYSILVSKPYFELNSNSTTLAYVNQEGFSELPLLYPPMEEQQRIVEFLDHKTSEIDQAIAQKQRLIELLHERKDILINQAITKGLNPKVRLKPSGVEWLGEVPEHWEVWRSKRLFSPRKELARSDDIQLSATQAYGVIPQDEYEHRIGRKVTKIFHHLEKRRHVEVGDFVISMRSFQGGLERAWAKGCIRSSYIVLKPSVQIDVDFFSYVFKSQAYISALQTTANFIRDGQDLNFDNFCTIDLVLPPIEEQRTIAQALNVAVASTVKTAERVRKEIDLLREFRQIVIANAVTGKMKV